VLVTRTLDRIGIDYFVTGSVASSLQGEPRATHDIDVVVAMEESQIDALTSAFPPPVHYLSRPSVVEAVRRRTMFNLIALDEGDKVDFWLLTNDPFDQSRLARRVTDEVFGVHLKVSSPEDTILAKLKWCRDSGGSEKQFQDALRVYELQFRHLDHGYLAEWAAKLHVEPEWRRLQQQAQPL
jgi:hypothetical protein